MSFISQADKALTQDEFGSTVVGFVMGVGTIILPILYGLTFVCHSGFVSWLLSFFTGSTLFFIIYVFGIASLFDVENPCAYETTNRDKNDRTVKQKLIQAWSKLIYISYISYIFILCVLSVSVVYYSNEYRYRYAFACDTHLVDHSHRIYHIIGNSCDVAAESSSLEKLKGHRIDESYSMCEWCEDWLDDLDRSDAYRR